MPCRAVRARPRGAGPPGLGGCVVRFYIFCFTASWLQPAFDACDPPLMTQKPPCPALLPSVNLACSGHAANRELLLAHSQGHALSAPFSPGESAHFAPPTVTIRCMRRRPPALPVPAAAPPPPPPPPPPPMPPAPSPDAALNAFGSSEAACQGSDGGGGPPPPPAPPPPAMLVRGSAYDGMSSRCGVCMGAWGCATRGLPLLHGDCGMDGWMR